MINIGIYDGDIVIVQKQNTEQYGPDEGEFRANGSELYLRRYFGRGAGRQVQPEPDLVQERVPQALFRTSPQVVHPSATDALAPAADFDEQIDL